VLGSPVSGRDIRINHFLLQAQASHARWWGWRAPVPSLSTPVKAAQEFASSRRTDARRSSGLITDIKEPWPEVAQGLVLTNAFYWDRDDETRRGRRFSDE